MPGPSSPLFVFSAQEMGGGVRLLVNSRRTLPEARHLGAYEVVFAAAQDPAHQAPATLELVKRRHKRWRVKWRKCAGSSPRCLRWSRAQRYGVAAAPQLRPIRRSTASTRPWRRTMWTATWPARSAESGNSGGGGFGRRRLAGFPPRHTEAIHGFGRAVTMVIRDSGGPGAAPARTVVAWWGPPGAGKANYAGQARHGFGISLRRATHIISYDGHRIAPSEQLRSAQPSGRQLRSTGDSRGIGSIAERKLAEGSDPH